MDDKFLSLEFLRYPPNHRLDHIYRVVQTIPLILDFLEIFLRRNLKARMWKVDALLLASSFSTFQNLMYFFCLNLKLLGDSVLIRGFRRTTGPGRVSLPSLHTNLLLFDVVNVLNSALELKKSCRLFFILPVEKPPHYCSFRLESPSYSLVLVSPPPNNKNKFVASW